jgi:hypothetical protein
MSEQNSYDKRVEIVKQRLQNELVDDKGRPVEPGEVDSVVDATAESLASAPVQEFVPLLIEHQATDELRQRGLHRDLGNDANDATPAESSVRSDDGGGADRHD